MRYCFVCTICSQYLKENCWNISWNRFKESQSTQHNEYRIVAYSDRGGYNDGEADFCGMCVVCDIRKNYMHVHINERIVFMFKLIKNHHSQPERNAFVKICHRLQALRIYRKWIWAISHAKTTTKIGTPTTLIMFYGAFIYWIDEALCFFFFRLTFLFTESSLTMFGWCTLYTVHK